MAYTHGDFLAAVNQAGMMNQFTEYDLNLAKNNPDAGMSILSYKQDYSKATTDEQRALANAGANKVRSDYGNYTADAYGNGYNAVSKAQAGINNTLDTIGSFGPYTDQYAKQRVALLDKVVNRPDFSWSKESDPQWGSYKKSYLREGDRATANTLAQTSAASGGRPSSFAVNAASQAGDYYATKLNDAIPTLYQQAYDRYLNEFNNNLSALNAVNTQEQFDYSKYSDDYTRLHSNLTAYQGQDSIDYAKLLDSINLNRDEQRRKEDLMQLALDNSYRENTRQDSLTQLDIENALRTYQTSGYVTPELSSILGLTAGTPTADQSQNEWYRKFQNAQLATNQSQFDREMQYQYAALEANKKKDGGDDAPLDTALNAFESGDRSDETINELLNAGYTLENLEKMAGQPLEYSKKTDSGSGWSFDGVSVDMDSVKALGYGDITPEQLEELYDKHYVTATMYNGKLVFKNSYLPAGR